MNKLVEKKTGDYHQTPAEFDKWFISFDDDDEMFVFIDTGANPIKLFTP